MIRRCRQCQWVSDRDTDLPAEEQAVQHAQDSCHPLCPVCGQSQTAEDPNGACEACLTAVRADLAKVCELYAELPSHLGSIRGQTFGQRPGGDEHALPGGTLLALLGPGSDGGAARRLTRTDIERGVDGREHKVDNRPEDTTSVAWSLFTWAQVVSDARGDGAYQDGAPTEVAHSVKVPDLCAYLEVHGRWFANADLPFPEFCEDIRQLRATLERATGRVRNPVKAGAACFACGGGLQRRIVTTTVTSRQEVRWQWWLPGAIGPLPQLLRTVERTGDVEEDLYTCVVCKEQYDPARYNLALKAAAEAASRVTLDGEQWATPAALATDLGRPENTLHRWRRDGLVRATLVEGVTFFASEDARREHEARPMRRTA